MQSLVVFVVSTTGDGEVMPFAWLNCLGGISMKIEMQMPDASKPAWQMLLRKDLPAGALAGIAFTVFGLGDSRYGRLLAVSLDP